MPVNPRSVRMPKAWHRIAFLLMVLAYTTGLMPMLIWPLSGFARAYCVACGLIGTVAMGLLVAAAIRRLNLSGRCDVVDELTSL